jgi:peptidoglycan/xylan/chitin deacetylase (PgdA/CDA1 family)
MPPFFRAMTLLVALFPGGSPSEPLPEIATWSRFRTAALSLTFDDNTSGQFAKALPLLDAHDLKGTFFVITEKMDGAAWKRAATAASRGHEIASHTVAHLVLTRETPEIQEDQLVRSQRIIDSLIPFRKCLTFAYPYGAWDSITLAAVGRHYLAARVVTSAGNPATPPDFLRVGGRGPSPGMRPEVLGDWLDEALAKGQWMVEVYHGIDDEGSEPITLTWLSRHLEDIERHRESLWQATFLEVARYARERDCARVSAGPGTDSTRSYTLSDTLPDAPFAAPLSLRMELPQGWAGARVLQGGKPVWSQAWKAAGKAGVMFEAVPDRGKIVLRRSPAE